MRVDREKKTVWLSKEDLEKSYCPLRPSWGIRMLQIYGLERTYRSDFMEALKRCPDVLKALGYRVFTEEGTEL